MIVLDASESRKRVLECLGIPRTKQKIQHQGDNPAFSRENHHCKREMGIMAQCLRLAPCRFQTQLLRMMGSDGRQGKERPAPVPLSWVPPSLRSAITPSRSSLAEPEPGRISLPGLTGTRLDSGGPVRSFTKPRLPLSDELTKRVCRRSWYCGITNALDLLSLSVGLHK